MVKTYFSPHILCFFLTGQCKRGRVSNFEEVFYTYVHTIPCNHWRNFLCRCHQKVLLTLLSQKIIKLKSIHHSYSAYIFYNFNVFRYSYYGVSRSASVVIAYLMKKHQISFDESFKRFVLFLFSYFGWF